MTTPHERLRALAEAFATTATIVEDTHVEGDGTVFDFHRAEFDLADGTSPDAYRIKARICEQYLDQGIVVDIYNTSPFAPLGSLTYLPDNIIPTVITTIVNNHQKENQ